MRFDRLLAAFTLAILLSPALPTPSGAETLPTGFSIEQIGYGPFVGNPVGFTLLPDGRVVMIERSTGRVRLNAVGATSSVFVHQIPNVNGVDGERGLLGVTHDPDWPTRPYLYFCYTNVDSTSDVIMMTASGDLSDGASTNLSLTDPYELLTDIPDDRDIHQAGTLRFGPDGMLYVSTGDDGWGCQVQDRTTLAGNILRLDVSSMPGAGSGPPPKADITPVGNPFPGPNENEKLVWVWGLRNPFRFTIDAPTGDLFIGDVGRNQFEEVNHVPFAPGAGENFAWPILEGTSDTGLGLTCGLGNTFTDPIWFYPRVGASSVIGGPVFRHAPSSPESFPSWYDGRYFVTDFFHGWVRCLENIQGVWQTAPPVPGQPSPDNWGEGFFWYSDFQLGPDGALYLCRLLNGSLPHGVYRVYYTPATDAAPSLAGTHGRITAYPNPARAAEGTTLRWSRSLSQPGTVSIHDAAGRLVRRLVAPAGASGGSAHWDGRTAGGHGVPAGIYFFRLEGAGRPSAEGKLLLLR